MNSRVLETNRLILYETSLNDLRELWNILIIDDINKYLLIPINGETLEDNKKCLYDYLLNSTNKYCWTIVLKELDEIIGHISVNKDNYNIRVFIDVNYQMMGYAYEAVTEVIKYLFLEIGIDNISANCSDNNLSGCILLEKLGFKKNKIHLQKHINMIDLEKYEYSLNKKDYLLEYFRKEKLHITIDIDKDPYIKHLSDDLVINITGESGSGKTTLCSKYLDDDNYIVIDTDLLVKEDTNNKECLNLRRYLLDKYGKIPDRILEFDLLYKEIIDYFKDSNKWIVIDSSQFRNIRDYSLLKGDIIILRTCINNCYSNCLKRYCTNHTFEEITGYSTRKKGIYKWYHKLNYFIDKLDKL